MAHRLREAAIACCDAPGEESASKFVDILSEPFRVSNRGGEWRLQCEDLLRQARSLLDPTEPSNKQLIDIVGVDLPKVVVLYGDVSTECQENSPFLIQCLATAYDPAREMFTVFIEAINIYSRPKTLHLCPPLVWGLSLVFPRIERRTAEFFKNAVPGLVELGRSMRESQANMFDGSSEETSNDTFNFEGMLISEDHDLVSIQNDVIKELIHLTKVIKGMCEGEEMDKLRDIMGIFTLQLLSLASGAVNESNNAVPDEVLTLLHVLSSSSISLGDLVSTSKIDKILDVVFDEEETKSHENRLEARRGESLAIFWAIQMDDADTASGDAAELKQRILKQTPGRQMVLNIIRLTSTLLVHMPGTDNLSFQHKGLCLMTLILESYGPHTQNDGVSQPDDALELSIKINPALQRLQDVIVHIPSPMLRRQAYGILMKVITEVLPPEARFATLHSLISNCAYSSLVSLLMTCVKDEVRKAWPTDASGQDVNRDTTSPFINSRVLDFIQVVIQKQDGPFIELPTNVDAALGALNFYLFLLLRESKRSTSYTHVLRKEELVKGRSNWLLPLREHIYRVQSELQESEADTTEEIRLGLDILKSTVYRCIEVVEEHLAKQP